MGFEVAELSDEIHTEIQRLSAIGDELANARKFSDAIPVYWTAWDLLPEPKTDWNAATWLLTAIGDANLFEDQGKGHRDAEETVAVLEIAVRSKFLSFSGTEERG